MERNLQALSEYYQSQAWAEKRTARLKIDGFKCARCGFTRALEVHHINYERFMHEDISRDLITLCKKCHKEIEGQKALQDEHLFDPLPSGNYFFAIKNHAVRYSNSSNLPPNTQAVEYRFEIPYYRDNNLIIATVIYRLNVYAKSLRTIRQFTDCIGLTPEKGLVTVDLEKADGKTGICTLSTIMNKSGDKINVINNFYAPSKSPNTENFMAWREYIKSKENQS